MSVYIIAELGINHNGDPDTLERMVDAAARAGADAIKFQVGNPDDYISGEDRDVARDTPWGRMRYADYRQRLELSDADLLSAAARARQAGLGVGVSPLDAYTVLRLERIGLEPDFLKVASPKIVDTGVLHIMRATGRPTILSTGMADDREIDNAVIQLDPWAVLHCRSQYPCPDYALDLSRIADLMARYPNCRIGYSGHESGLPTTFAAVGIGASVIERHLTLDRAMWGSDQAASIEPDGWVSLVNGIRAIERALTTPPPQPPLPNARKFRHQTTAYATNAH